MLGSHFSSFNIQKEWIHPIVYTIYLFSNARDARYNVSK